MEVSCLPGRFPSFAVHRERSRDCGDRHQSASWNNLARAWTSTPEAGVNWREQANALIQDDRGGRLLRRRTWCVSTHPEFATKAAELVGLYLNPPLNALVLSVDEKPSIQAIPPAT